MRLLCRVERRDFRSRWNRLRERRTGIGHDHASGFCDGVNQAAALRLFLHGARGEDPQCAIAADAPSVEEACGFFDLLQRGVWTAEHDVVDVAVPGAGVDRLVSLPPLGLA